MKFKSLLFMAVLAGSIVQASAQLTLRDATNGQFLMGVAVNDRQTANLDSEDAKLIGANFSAIVPENCMKSSLIHPEENRWDFANADRVIEMGQKFNQVVTGHCLIWHSQLARWFTVDSQGKEVSPEVLKERMRNHIYTLVKRYKGKIKGWDVVNEAMEDNGTYRNSKFYQILGKDFIKLAFQYAHEADPDAELYYNDYSMAVPEKCDAVVQMVNELKDAGCRIDAVGMQGHITMDGPSVAAFETSIKKLIDAGVKVMVTEWDISILPNPYNHQGANVSDNFNYSKEMDPYTNGVPDSAMQAWNTRVLDMFGLFLKYNKEITRVTVWGLNDAMSWRNGFPIRGRKDYALLFDRENRPKAVVAEMIKMAATYK